MSRVSSEQRVNTRPIIMYFSKAGLIYARELKAFYAEYECSILVWKFEGWIGEKSGIFQARSVGTKTIKILVLENSWTFSFF